MLVASRKGKGARQKKKIVVHHFSEGEPSVGFEYRLHTFADYSLRSNPSNKEHGRA